MSRIDVRLGAATSSAPVKLSLLDARLRPVARRWVRAESAESFDVEAGVFVVHAEPTSGERIQQVVRVKEGEEVDCRLDLQAVSPHEGHEWAYLTQPLDRSETSDLTHTLYDGAWLRLWRLHEGKWRVVALPETSQLSMHEDGISCTFDLPNPGLFAVQVGGPRIPWKLTTIPPTHTVMLLVRPVEIGESSSRHPLEMVVCSNNFDAEGLLSLLQRGNTEQACDLAGQPAVAERLLNTKVRDAAAAAVGGYYLLRARELHRMHDWGANLANWFEWMPDGPVIRGWQLILESGRDSADRTRRLDRARDRLLCAVERGFPIYTEGLRLLRDGLLLLHRRNQARMREGFETEDSDLGEALERVGRYVAVADWACPVTTFTGAHPGEPMRSPPIGEPEEGPKYFLYDVPIDAAVSAGALAEGEELEVILESGRLSVRVQGDVLQSADGQVFSGTSGLERAGADLPRTMGDSARSESLLSAVERLRIRD